MSGHDFRFNFSFVHAVLAFCSPLTKHLAVALHVMAVAILALVYWHGLAPMPQVAKPDPVANLSQIQAPTLPPALQNLARLLGDASMDANMALTPPNIQLMGVAAGPQDAGAAVMSVDGQAAKSYAVGDMLVQGWQLKAVMMDGVLLARGPVTHRVDMPKKP